MKRIHALAIGTFAAALALGCASNSQYRASDTWGERNARSMSADHARAIDLAASTTDDLVVGVGTTFVRGIDATTGTEVWRLPVIPSAHVFSLGTAVFIPRDGNRLLAVERQSGELLWDTYVPGEIIGGSAAGGVATVTLRVDISDHKYAVAGVGVLSGALRWVRRTTDRLGEPVSLHRQVVVPTSEGTVAFASGTGRRLQRLQMQGGALDIEASAGGVWALSDETWHDLVHDEVTPPRVADAHVLASRFGMDLDMGYSEQDGRRWFVEDDGESAFLLAHRAVLRVGLGPDGKPDDIVWVHVADAGSEYVALARTGDAVKLVGLRGDIVELDAASGEERTRVGAATGAPLLGADFGQTFALQGELPPATTSSDERVGAVAQLIGIDDPRLFHAQLVAMDTAARNSDERRVVQRVADSGLRGGRSEASVALRDYARGLLVEVPVDAAVLKEGAGFSDAQPRGYARAALHARRYNNKEALPDMVRRLEDPRTPAGELSGLAQALCGFDQNGTEAVARFARMYHADPLTSLESDAVEQAVDCLRGVAAAEGPGAAEARRTLDLITEDPFTDRRLLAYLRSTRPGPTPIEVAIESP